ncbi:MAG: hypothetical protein ACAH07_00265 [Methylophilaceae bacterium]|nr:hypothetical protein [Methyloradius sp.]
MQAIGGYLGFELDTRRLYHSQAIALNTARNALEYVIAAKKYKKIYVPYFTCDSLLQPIIRLGLAFEQYAIDVNFEPIFDYTKLGEQEVFLYTNYFGLKDEFIIELNQKGLRLIVDNAQAFFSLPLEGAHTMYSPRKFLGVPDGAYLYTDTRLDQALDIDKSFQRFEHLLARLDGDAEDGYSQFIGNENILSHTPLRYMSRLTQNLLTAVDYPTVMQQRRLNFEQLHQALGAHNAWDWLLRSGQVPLTYPFYTRNTNLRVWLKENRVFTPQYWREVLDVVTASSIEHDYVSNIIHLPIDQRYGESDMQRVIELVKLCK